MPAAMVGHRTGHQSCLHVQRMPQGASPLSCSLVLAWLTVSMVQAAAELAELTATCDRDQAANEAEWDTLTQLIEADRRQQASL